MSDIKEHMEVIGADGVHVGTVDRVEGNRIMDQDRVKPIKFVLTSEAAKLICAQFIDASVASLRLPYGEPDSVASMD